MLIRSRRKTLEVEIRAGRLLVRAPLRAGTAQIEAFLEQHRAWIEAHLAQARQREAVLAAQPRLSPEELAALRRRAAEQIPARVAHYAPLLGVSYGKISIRYQKTRWGSCSAAGNLSFNCLLMLAPPEVLDSVVVHELCHRKQMNHSGRFYAELLRVLPDYPQRRRWLKTNGPLLLARLRPEAAPPAAPICPQRRSLAATCAPTPRSPA